MFDSRLSSSNNEFQQQLAQKETQSKLDDAKVLPLQSQVDRLKTELDTLTTHNAWLNEQWQSQTEQLQKVRTSHATELAQLRAQLVEKTQEQQESVALAEQYQSDHVALAERQSRLSRELREAKTTAAEDLARVQEELVESQSLVNLQKNQLELLQSKHDSLASQLEALQTQALEAEQEMQLGMLEHSGDFRALSTELSHSFVDIQRESVIHACSSLRM